MSTMPAESPGQAVRPRKPKEQTKRENTHTYESFTKRIARLKIDPIHDVSKQSIADNPSDFTNSHFRAALDEWSELNLSIVFTGFLNKVDPISGNLPQLLHHADAVFDLLIQHIEKKDGLALEPLLSLAAHFAHDLGKEFEKYFAQTISLIAEVAATHGAADVIEWCFTSIAWLFKYLSRLLVQDLTPLLSIMKPYLSARKEHIARFSAESLAFLLRKAMGLYSKRKGPLTLALKALLKPLTLITEPAESHHGLLTLLVESCLGTERHIHSAAECLVQCLLSTAHQLGPEPGLQHLLERFIIGVIHRTDRDGFQPVINVLLDTVSSFLSAQNSEGLGLITVLLRAAIGTRKASRIQDWSKVLSLLNPIYESRFFLDGKSEERQVILSTAALALQYAPVNELLPYSHTLLDACIKNSTTTQFFAFCTLVADLGKGRFQDFVLPKLQQYIITNYLDNEIGLMYLLERLHSLGIICTDTSKPDSVQSSSGWDELILGHIRAGSIDDLSVEFLAGIARLRKNIAFPAQDGTRTQLSDELASIICQSLELRVDPLTLKRRITIGWLFEAFVDLSNGQQNQLLKVQNSILQAPAETYKLSSFLNACVQLSNAGSASTTLKARPTDNILDVLTNNMLASSLSIKLGSLRFLQTVDVEDTEKWLTDTIDLLLEIALIEYSPTSTRTISMLLRRLPPRQKQVSSIPWMQRLIPFFCLGLLSSYHDQTRRELCIILGEMVQDAPIQDTVFDVLSVWLRSPPSVIIQPTQQTVPHKKLSPFECSNMNDVRKTSLQVFEDFMHPAERMRALAEEAHQIMANRIPESGRALALESLMAMPIIAEKRSRMISPIFLNAQFDRNFHESVLPSESSTTSLTLSPELSEQEWSFLDRRAFLKLLGEFNNPKVLSCAGEVHEKLTDLLRSGSVEIRKLSLTALLKWKDPVLQKHEKILFQIIEEKTVSAEIGLILNAEAEANPIRPDERSVFLPVLLRLLYGSIVGHSGTYGSQEARRKSILRMLFRMEEAEVGLFLKICLGRLVSVNLQSAETVLGPTVDHDLVPADQQYGFTRLILSFLETLESQFAPYGKAVVDAVLYCTFRACRKIDSANTKHVGAFRNTRRVGLQCLEKLFEHCPDANWPSYMPALFVEAICPRLGTLPAESAQGISGLLRIFSVWAKTESYIPFFCEYDQRLLATLWQCLAEPYIKSEVQIFILNNILRPLLDLVEKDQSSLSLAYVALSSSLVTLLQSLAWVLQQKPEKDVLVAMTSAILVLAPLANLSNDSDKILHLLVDALADGKGKIPPLTRSRILSAIRALLQIRQNSLGALTSDKLLHTIASLFNYFRDEGNRSSLSGVLQLLTPSEGVAGIFTNICHDLNAVSAGRLDEVDYDRRLQAFNRVRTLSVQGVDSKFWEPVVYNLLFFSKDEDFTIRSNAVSALKDFIVRASRTNTSDVQSLVRDVVLPAVRNGVKDESEVIRADMIALFGLLVQHLEDQVSLQDLKPLLVDNDEEAAFFNNILHIQQHRRLRAVHRLTSEVDRGKIKASNVAHFFLPLLMKFVKDQSTEESAQSMKGQSLQALTTLLKWIDWKQFKSFFKQTKQELAAEEQNQKIAIKVLVHAADALSQAWEESQAIRAGSHVLCHLAASLPPHSELVSDVKDQLLTKLAGFIHYRDEAEMIHRLPAATVAVNLIKLCLSPEIQVLAAPIVLDVSNVLRSRSSESRDAARRTLTDIVILLGPSSVLFVLKELRTALKRGYQLHVLSYTLHSILVTLSSSLSLGDLDYCLEDLVAVVMDDIFGIVGQEKENQDYISSMKEVKSSKSFDSMELLARSATMEHLVRLLDPIVILLTGSLNAKQTRHVDELLRRIGVGLARNPAACERDILTFAYQAIQRFYKAKPTIPARSCTQDERNRDRFLIKHMSDTKAAIAGSSPLLYKVARFAVDNVRSALQKHSQLLIPENVHGFLPIIGDALVEAQEDVKSSAMRLLSTIIKLRMPELDANSPLYVQEAVKVVRHANSTHDEAAQAALKLVTAILRERKSSQIRESDVTELLRRITPDLEEPDRQGVTFNFIRAVMLRKYQVPELYELADRIGMMMVTNQDRGARDVARGVYVHFLLEYPQSPARWTKQQKFLIKNLEYEHVEGRESVMEAVNLLLAKSSADTSQQLVSAFFLPIVVCMANEDHPGCRELAGALLSQLFKKALTKKRTDFLDPLHSWIQQNENPSLRRIGMQAFGILFVSISEGLESDVKLVKRSIESTLDLISAEDGEMTDVLCQTLRLMLKLAETRPASVLGVSSESAWSSVQRLLHHSDSLVRSEALSIIAAFFQSCRSGSISKLPLTNIHGLKLNEPAMQALLKSTLRLMKQLEGTSEQSARAVSILTFLGRCVDVNGLKIPVKARSEDEVDEDGDENSEDDHPMQSIPAIQYLLDQSSRLLRRESVLFTSNALLPKASALNVLSNVIPQLSGSSLPPSTIRNLLIPLVHITDTNTQAPRSADPNFGSAYSALVSLSQEIMDALQSKVGDQMYIKAMTEVSRLVRERREDRRRKRAIEKVAQPERAAQTKRKKTDRKKEKNKEVGRLMGQRRKGLA